MLAEDYITSNNSSSYLLPRHTITMANSGTMDRLEVIKRPRQSTSHVQLKHLKALYHLPLHRVANHLGVCESAVKKICRRLGIKHWPYRQLNSITLSINSLYFSIERLIQSEEEKQHILFEIDELKHDRLMLLIQPDGLLNPLVFEIYENKASSNKSIHPGRIYSYDTNEKFTNKRLYEDEYYDFNSINEEDCKKVTNLKEAYEFINEFKNHRKLETRIASSALSSSYGKVGGTKENNDKKRKEYSHQEDLMTSMKYAAIESSSIMPLKHDILYSIHYNKASNIASSLHSHDYRKNENGQHPLIQHRRDHYLPNEYEVKQQKSSMIYEQDPAIRRNDYLSERYTTSRPTRSFSELHQLEYVKDSGIDTNLSRSSRVFSASLSSTALPSISELQDRHRSYGVVCEKRNTMPDYYHEERVIPSISYTHPISQFYTTSQTTASSPAITSTCISQIESAHSTSSYSLPPIQHFLTRGPSSVMPIPSSQAQAPSSTSIHGDERNRRYKDMEN